MEEQEPHPAVRSKIAQSLVYCLSESTGPIIFYGAFSFSSYSLSFSSDLMDAGPSPTHATPASTPASTPISFLGGFVHLAKV